jgi:hypothetical protein
VAVIKGNAGNAGYRLISLSLGRFPHPHEIVLPAGFTEKWINEMKLLGCVSTCVLDVGIITQHVVGERKYILQLDLFIYLQHIIT